MAIDNLENVISVSDLTDRVEELEEAREYLREEFDAEPANAGVDFDAWVCNQLGYDREEQDELEELSALLDDLKGNGGDHQWRGDWYPATLIRDSYFKDYAQELAEDIGAVNPDASWPNNCIDWDQAARELRMDYSACEVDGVTYWYR